MATSLLLSRMSSTTSQIHILLSKVASPKRPITRTFFLSAAQGSRRKNNTANLSATTATTTATTATSPSTKQTTTKNPFSAPANSVLAYVGPYAGSLRQCKSVAFVFGACGCIAVPSTLFLGNTEHILAVLDNVTKIHVQGSAATNTAAAAVKVSSADNLKLTFEKLNWRGVPLQTQCLSSDLRIQSETEKVVTWTTENAKTVSASSSSPKKSSSSSSPPVTASTPKKSNYKIDKVMMLSNPSFSFVLDQIEHQSRLSRGKSIKA
ncbi:hypothetical protein BGZ83_003766 [Gryganskiella cystojenkinii]|nr:hypothetical protein BGZ83_003766 [Gryganskiella cystojenkinii]